MHEIELKKYAPINPVLKKLIKYYWIMKSNKEIDIHGKLMPMNNIDLIINLSTPIKYNCGTKKETFTKSHFNGIQNKFRIVHQKGILDIIGISFHPSGFYPIVKVPLSEFKNNIILVDDVIHGFEKKIGIIAGIESDYKRISIIEEVLMKIIDTDLLPEKDYDILTNEFLIYGDNINIKKYCKKHNVSQKSLERYFLKHIGTTPKAFINTTKFQKTIKKLLMGNYDSMTQLGYEFNYYDQTHFINSFKSFIGNTPTRQLKDNDLIIDILPKS
jgi:AraC-like DNA-binding protein